MLFFLPHWREGRRHKTLSGERYILCAVLCLVAQSCLSLCHPVDCGPPGSSVHGDAPGKNTGVGCHALFQRFFLTQRSNPGLWHCKQILYHPNHQGSPRKLEWVAYPFFRGSSPPGNQTEVSCIEGEFFTSWATRGVPGYTITRTWSLHVPLIVTGSLAFKPCSVQWIPLWSISPRRVC